MNRDASILWLSNHSKQFHFTRSGYRRLQNNELRVTKAFKKYEIPKQIDWSADPFKSKSWRLYFHSLDWLHSFRFGIVNEKNSEKLEYVMSLIFDWWDNNSNPENSDSMAWDDHATSNRLANLCFWIQMLNDSDDDKIKLIHMINFHCKKIKDFFNNGHWIATNHAIFHIAALINVNVVIPRKYLEINCEILAQNYLNKTLKSIIHTDSGFSVEQSIFYHQFVIREFKPLLEVISNSNSINSKGIETCVNKMIYFLDLISTDSGNVPALGDTAFGFRVDPKYKNIVKGENFSFCFQETGLAIFGGRSSKGQNIGTFSFHKDRTSHGHFSPLNFTLILDDNKVLVDSGGSYAYGEKFRFQYIVSNFAHNCIVVGGLNSKNGSNYINSKMGEISYVTASSKSENSEVNRTVVSLLGQLFIIFDEIYSTVDSEVDTYWHFPPNVQSISNGNTFLDISLEYQKLNKSSLSQTIVQIADSEYVFAISSLAPIYSSISYGISGDQPQGWVTPGHRKIDPAHCLKVSSDKLNSVQNSTIIYNKELDYEIVSQSHDEVLISSIRLGQIKFINGKQGLKIVTIK